MLDLKQFWPKIEESDDMSDWFEHGGGTAERLLEIVEQLPDYKPEGGGNGYDGALHEHAHRVCQLPVDRARQSASNSGR